MRRKSEKSKSSNEFLPPFSIYILSCHIECLFTANRGQGSGKWGTKCVLFRIIWRIPISSLLGLLLLLTSFPSTRKYLRRLSLYVSQSFVTDRPTKENCFAFFVQTLLSLHFSSLIGKKMLCSSFLKLSRIKAPFHSLRMRRHAFRLSCSCRACFFFFHNGYKKTFFLFLRRLPFDPEAESASASMEFPDVKEAARPPTDPGKKVDWASCRLAGSNAHWDGLSYVLCIIYGFSIFTGRTTSSASRINAGPPLGLIFTFSRTNNCRQRFLNAVSADKSVCCVVCEALTKSFFSLLRVRKLVGHFMLLGLISRSTSLLRNPFFLFRRLNRFAFASYSRSRFFVWPVESATLKRASPN